MMNDKNNNPQLTTHNLPLVKPGYKKTETAVKSEIDEKLNEVENKVNNNLHKMGFKL